MLCSNINTPVMEEILFQFSTGIAIVQIILSNLVFFLHSLISCHEIKFFCKQ